jgi:hypothetical protein
MAAYSTDPALYIYTSLTAGSSHIVTATSRLETILRANRVPFKAIDIATDEKARMLWGRRAGKDEGGRMRKLPGLVQEGLVLGDIVEIEEWNEYGELKMHVKIYFDEFTIPSINDKLPEPIRPRPAKAASAVAAAAASASKSASVPAPAPAPAAPPAPPMPEPKSTASQPASKPKTEPAKPTVLPIRSVADEAAQKAKELRLRSLREKVHGKKMDGESAAEDKPATEKSESQSNAASEDDKTAGLQSPTTGTWKQDSNADTLRDTLQSPTSAAWKSGSLNVNAPESHMGAKVEVASQEEIKAIESAAAIKEEPELEENLAKKEAEKEKPKQAVKKEESSEEEDDDEDDDDEEDDEDDDDEDDDDDSDEDDSDEEEDPKVVKKEDPKLAKTEPVAQKEAPKEVRAEPVAQKEVQKKEVEKEESSEEEDSDDDDDDDEEEDDDDEDDSDEEDPKQVKQEAKPDVKKETK